MVLSNNYKKTNKANGQDKVPDKLLRESAMECGSMFHHLFCLSYQHGTLPSYWTHALVCPVYKKSRIFASELQVCVTYGHPLQKKLTLGQIFD